MHKLQVDPQHQPVRQKRRKFALMIMARKLRPYFQAHALGAANFSRIKPVLHKLKVSGRLAKWAVELEENDVIFRQATAIKSQVLADFVAEFSPTLLPALEQEVRLQSKTAEEETGITPIVQYLENDILPHDRNESRKIKKKSARNCISQGILYRRSF
ncbi:hypothetical protein Bca101_043840 [Brassica carinata]